MNDLRITSFQRAERLLAVDGRTPGGMLLAPLVPLSYLYGLAMRARAALYARGLLRQQILPCRVISVGNLTVGGTGKTAVVIALAAALRDRGGKLGVISRGYKRRSGTPILEISDGRTLRGHPGDSGDEPFLIAQRCSGVPVAVGADRPLVGRYLVDRFDLDTLVLDDGFQHLALRRDMDILVLDAGAPFGNGICFREDDCASRSQPWSVPRRCSSRAPRRPSGWTGSKPWSAQWRRRCRSGSRISRRARSCRSEARPQWSRPH